MTPTQKKSPATAPKAASASKKATASSKVEVAGKSKATEKIDAKNKAAPTKAAPTKAAPTKAAPTKAAPTKAAPTKAAPTKAAPTKAAPTKAAPALSEKAKASVDTLANEVPAIADSVESAQTDRTLKNTKVTPKNIEMNPGINPETPSIQTAIISPKATKEPLLKDLKSTEPTQELAPEIDVTFSSLIDDTLLYSCIEQAGFTNPTAVQARALPFTLRAKDVCAFAQTGTGKTAVIAVTAGQKLIENAETRGQSKKPLVLVLVPTRELAVQVELDMHNLLKPLDAETIATYGGDSMDKQIQALTAGVDVIVATPGRVLDLYKNKHFDLDCIKLFVCDEADRMFDMGFIEDVEYFLKQIPAEGVQKLFTSATGSEKVRELAFEYLDEPEYIEANPETITPEKIKQGVFAVPAIEKFQVLLGHIKTEKPKCAIIFTNTKVVAEWVAYKLACNDVSAEALTGDLPQAKRMGLIKQIKDGKLQILVATDVLSRGLHVVGLSHVYNFDIPEESESFVHRIGRTARAGAEGTAVSFVCEDYGFHMGGVEQLLGFSIPVWTAPSAFYQIEDKSDYPFDENGRIKSYPFAPSASTQSKEADTTDRSSEKPRHKEKTWDKPLQNQDKITAKAEVSAQPIQDAAETPFIGSNRIVPASKIVATSAPSASDAIAVEVEKTTAPAVVIGGIQPQRIQPKVAATAVSATPVSQTQILQPQKTTIVASATNASVTQQTYMPQAQVASTQAQPNLQTSTGMGVGASANQNARSQSPKFASSSQASNGTGSQFGKTSGSASPDFQNKRDDRVRDEKAREAVEEALAAAKNAANRRRALAAQPPRGSAEEALLSAGEKIGETLGFIKGKVESITNRGVPLFNELIERFRSGFQKQVDKQRDGY